MRGWMSVKFFPLYSPVGLLVGMGYVMTHELCAPHSRTRARREGFTPGEWSWLKKWISFLTQVGLIERCLHYPDCKRLYDGWTPKVPSPPPMLLPRFLRLASHLHFGPQDPRANEFPANPPSSLPRGQGMWWEEAVEAEVEVLQTGNTHRQRLPPRHCSGLQGRGRCLFAATRQRVIASSSNMRPTMGKLQPGWKKKQKKKKTKKRTEMMVVKSLPL